MNVGREEKPQILNDKSISHCKLQGKVYFQDDIVIHLLQLASVIGNSM